MNFLYQLIEYGVLGLLLTIVLTTSTFIATDSIQVKLPKGETSAHSLPLQPQIVAIDRAGRIWLGGTPVCLEGLTTALGVVDRQMPVLVRADRGLVLPCFVDVFAATRQQGFSLLSLQAEQRP